MRSRIPYIAVVMVSLLVTGCFESIPAGPDNATMYLHRAAASSSSKAAITNQKKERCHKYAQRAAGNARNNRLASNALTAGIGALAGGVLANNVRYYGWRGNTAVGIVSGLGAGALYGAANSNNATGDAYTRALNACLGGFIPERELY